MPKVIPHQKPVKPPKPPKRYIVQRKDKAFPGGAWKNFSDHHFLWKAIWKARSWESVGYFYYRVLDMQEDE